MAANQCSSTLDQPYRPFLESRILLQLVHYLAKGFILLNGLIFDVKRRLTFEVDVSAVLAPLLPWLTSLDLRVGVHVGLCSVCPPSSLASLKR